LVAVLYNLPTGLPNVLGTPAEDQTLTADTSGIADVDGLGAFSYQWLRDGVAIGGANGATYTLGDADVDTRISVEITYTDAQGTNEGPLTSIETALVANVNDDPFVLNPIGNLSANEDDPNFNMDLASFFSDIDDASLQYSINSNDNTPLVEASVAGNNLVLDYNANQFGAAAIVVRATDSSGAFVDEPLMLNVMPVNDVPNVSNNTYQGAAAETISGNLLNGSFDVDGDNLTANLVTPPSNGNFILNPDGSFTFTPGTSFSGTEQVSFLVTDGNGAVVPATADIEVSVPTTPTTPITTTPILPTPPNNTVNPAPPNNTTTSPNLPAPLNNPVTDPISVIEPNVAAEPPAPSTEIENGPIPQLNVTPQVTNFDVPIEDQANSIVIDAIEEVALESERSNSFVFEPATEPSAFTPAAVVQTTAQPPAEVNHTTEQFETLDLFEQSMDQAAEDVNFGFTVSVVSMTGVSIGVVSWMLRTGGLVASMMANIPAWRSIDPMIVLGHKTEEDEDDESVLDIVDSQPVNNSAVASHTESTTSASVQANLGQTKQLAQSQTVPAQDDTKPVAAPANAALLSDTNILQPDIAVGVNS